MDHQLTFSWRHWATFIGSYRGHEGQGQMYEFCMVDVNDKLEIQNVQICYKPEEFLELLEGKRDIGDLLDQFVLT